ncbi:MAG TPA: DUF4397 domain-containing protein [Casimicrobiaceae bacterium]|nr:DUF4397 domain-containing protein [Casimicrobiaceae bacterium]
MPKLLKSLAVIVALPLLLAGCKINSINYFPPTPTHFRIVNVLGTTTPIDVTANGASAWTNLAFEAMTGYLDFDNVTTNFTVSLSGSTTPLVSQTYNPAGNQYYTLVVYGTLFAPSIGVMADPNIPPPSGKFALNVFNAAPVGNGIALALSPLDIYLTPPGQTLDNATPVFTYISYQTTNVFGQYEAGQYQLRFTIAGTKTVVYDSGPLTFQDQTSTDLIIYSRGSQVLANVLLNESDGPGLQVVANSKLSRLKVVNGAFQAGAVNQSLNGVAGVSNLALATASTYSIIPSGTSTVGFEANSAPGATIASLAYAFIPARDHSVFVSGFSGSTTATGLVDNNSPPLTNYASVRFVNTSPDSAPLDVYSNDTLQAKAVGTNAASAYVSIAGGTSSTLTFKDSTTQSTVLTIPNFSVASLVTYSVYVIGPAGGLVGLITADTP